MRSRINRILFLCFAGLAGCTADHTASSGTNGQKADAVQENAVMQIPMATGWTDTTHDGRMRQDTMIADEQLATYYILILDTGMHYTMLDQQMYRVSRKLGIAVDTMERYYDPAKSSIILSPDDPDELYAGEYFPRRFPSRTLSMEHLDMYVYPAGKNSFALVAGIYDNLDSAAFDWHRFIKEAPRTFISKADMYIGCMH